MFKCHPLVFKWCVQFPCLYITLPDILQNRSGFLNPIKYSILLPWVQINQICCMQISHVVQIFVCKSFILHFFFFCCSTCHTWLTVLQKHPEKVKLTLDIGNTSAASWDNSSNLFNFCFFLYVHLLYSLKYIRNLI